jgi:phosphoglycolate phosphatase
MNIKNIIFDLDGTLIDSAPSILSTLTDTLSCHGFKPIINLDARIIGPPLDVVIEKVIGSNDLRIIQPLIDTFKIKYDSFGYKETVVFPGVNQLLKELNQLNIPIYIATNKRLKPTRLIIEHLGWSSLFKSIYALDCVLPAHLNKGKMLAQSLQDIGGMPQNIAYVGDKYEDGLAADTNSLPFIKACWGYGAREIEKNADGWKNLYCPADLMLLV